MWGGLKRERKVSGHLWFLKCGGVTGSLVPTEVDGSLRGSVAAASWPRAKMQALSNMDILGEILGPLGAQMGSDGTLLKALAVEMIDLSAAIQYSSLSSEGGRKAACGPG